MRARVFPTMPPKTLALAGLAALSLALVTALPVASADTATTALCGADVDFWGASYTCTVNGAGPTGSVNWCPDPLMCAGGDVFACYVDLTPPYYCQIL